MIPPIISKPGFPLLLTIHTHNPRRTKGTSARRLINNLLLILWRHCTLQNLFQLRLAKDSVKRFDDSFRGRDIYPFAPVSSHQRLERSFKFIIGVVIFDPGRYTYWLFSTSVNHTSTPQICPNALTNNERIGKSFGGTILSPNRRPVVSLSCFENSSFHFGVGVHGFPTLSRAPPRKKGIMSTETPWALSSGRYLMVLVNPNQEYGDTEAVNCEMGMGEVRGTNRSPRRR